MGLIKLIIFSIMCIGTLFSCSTLFVDTHITPKWIFFFGGGFIFGICHITSVLQDNKYSKKIYYYHIIIVISLLIQAIYGILQFKGIFKSVNSFNATGSFDNPAGFATSLSLGIPLCIYLFIISKKIISRICICIIICTIISAIIIAESRTGILTVFSIFLYKFINSFKFSTLLKTISFILLTITIIIGLYHFKQDSPNGRIFIWKCSIPMLQEKILKGHGKGGFEANYMKHQAKYFQLNPNSNYKWLADNIQHPFCEYIKITCDYGLIGLFSIFTSLFFLIYCYLKVPTLETETSILCLGSICILALFSYPLSYPFTWLIGLVSTYNLIKKFIHKQLKEEYSRILIRRLSLLPYVVLTLYIGYKTHLLLTTEIQWKDWVKHNLKEIRQISRSTWITLPENLKNPVFGAFTPQQKIIFWEERLNSILKLDWNSKERKHIIDLIYLIQKNPIWFDIEKRTEEIEDKMAISAFNWITYAKEELKWNNTIIGSIVASGNNLINKDGLLEMNTSTYSSELSIGREVDCNCNQTYNFCEGNEPCKEESCNEVNYCGWLLLSKCDGICGSL